MQTIKMVLCCTLSASLFVGCALFKSKTEGSTVRLYEQADSALPAEQVRTVEIPHAELKLAVSQFPTLTEQDVQSAELYDTAGGKAVFIRFDPNGSIMLDEMTTRLRGKYIAVMIDNRPVSAWLVDQRIVNGQFLIEGDLTDQEAKKVVDDLNKLSKKNRQ